MDIEGSAFCRRHKDTAQETALNLARVSQARTTTSRTSLSQPNWVTRARASMIARRTSTRYHPLHLRRLCPSTQLRQASAAPCCEISTNLRTTMRTKRASRQA
jgi:hypothetical protein